MRQLVLGVFSFVCLMSIVLGAIVFVIVASLFAPADDALGGIFIAWAATALGVFALGVIAFAAFAGVVAVAVRILPAQLARAVAAVGVGACLVLSLTAVLRTIPKFDARPSGTDSPTLSAADRADHTMGEAERKVARWLVLTAALTAVLVLILASPGFGDGPPADSMYLWHATASLPPDW